MPLNSNLQFNFVGAIRKAGFLSIKKWILKRKQSIELARKQLWKRYWVCLRGTTLLFHSVVERQNVDTKEENRQIIDLLSWVERNCKGQLNPITKSLQHELEDSYKDSVSIFSTKNIRKSMSHCFIETEARHMIVIDGAIAQPIPEHPKRDNVFCLSTTFGDAYLFQASCHIETDNWISAIHNACAAALARDSTKMKVVKDIEIRLSDLEQDATRKTHLRNRLESRLQSILNFTNIRHSDFLNQSFVVEQPSHNQNIDETKQTLKSMVKKLSQQLSLLDIHIEELQDEIFKLKCYLSSCCYKCYLSGEMLIDYLPHPRSLLIHVSKHTKLMLSKMGILSVSSFHAYLYARRSSSEEIFDLFEKKIPTSLIGNNNTKLSHDSLTRPSLKSKFISENTSCEKNILLEKTTKDLIEMTDLRLVKVKITKQIFSKITGTNDIPEAISLIDEESDDRFSLQQDTEFIWMNVKLNTKQDTVSIIQQIIKILTRNKDISLADCLPYYLRLALMKPQSYCKSGDVENLISFYIARRRETIEDWPVPEYLEILEKICFALELDIDSVPDCERQISNDFGMTLEGQLFCKNSSLIELHVFCNHIRWGAVADIEGLAEDDEIVSLNGILVSEVDMMFIEQILSEETKIELIVRSSRFEEPKNATLIKKCIINNDLGECGDQSKIRGRFDNNTENFKNSRSGAAIDSYISSLVCPRPPLENTNLELQSAIDEKEFTSAPHLHNKDTIIEPKSTSMHQIINHGVCSEKQELGENDSRFRRLSTGNNCDFEETSKVVLATEDTINSVRKTSNATTDNDTLNNKVSSKDEHQTVDSSSERQGDKSDSLQAVNSEEESKLGDHPERLKRATMELLETEVDYVKNLEKIIEHYMNPLDDVDNLGIDSLKNLNRIVRHLLVLQREFSEAIFNSILIATSSAQDAQEYSDDILKVIELNINNKSSETINTILSAIAEIFVEKAKDFKIYSSYCAVYSRLQRIMHPNAATTNLKRHSLCSSLPNFLDTYINTNGLAAGAASSNLLRPFTNHNLHSLSYTAVGGIIGNNSAVQLSQLTNFLSTLESASSSASSSLMKSSSGFHDSDKSKRGSSKSAPNETQKNIHLQNFESYLIKPVQRIVKYPLLLSAISNFCKTSTITFSCLKEASFCMESTVAHINLIQKVFDEYSILFDHIQRLYENNQLSLRSLNQSPSSSKANQSSIVLNADNLLHFGDVEWTNIAEFAPKYKKSLNLRSTLFVFSSCVIFICKEIRVNKKESCSTSTNNVITAQNTGNSKNQHSKQTDSSHFIRYQTLIPVKEVQVRSTPVMSNSVKQKSEVDGDVKNNFQWELFRCSSTSSTTNLLSKVYIKKNVKGKIYQFSNSSNEDRIVFLRKIRFIIRESVRKMSVPQMHLVGDSSSKK